MIRRRLTLLALLCAPLMAWSQAYPNKPIRLVVPWKYGYKSIKSIVRIRLVEKEPPTTWGAYNSREYGFYSNVNPEVDHPRWPQKEEQRLGSGFLGQGTRMPTVKFNGYGAQVASLYTGMYQANHRVVANGTPLDARFDNLALAAHAAPSITTAPVVAGKCVKAS